MTEQPITRPEEASGRSRRSLPRRGAWHTFLGLSFIFTLCVAAQVFIAGLAVFVAPAHWTQHTSFVHVFEFVPLLMLAISVVGRLPVRLRWLSAVLFALVYAQYFTANIRGLVPLVAARHPVVALVIFWLALRVVQETRHAMAVNAGGGA